MLLLNFLFRGCIFGLSGPLVSQMVGGGGREPWPPLAPSVPTPMHTALSLSLSPCYHLPHSPPPLLMYFFPSLLLPLPPPPPPTYFLSRLELQVSSLEREAQSKQQALTKTESQLAKYEPTLKQPTTKYKPTSKQKVLKRLRENVRQLTEELQQTKSSVAE